MQDQTVDQTSELDHLLNAYKTALEDWIGAIRHEEALVSGNHTVTELDQWEAAHFAEEDMRAKAKDAKKQYEDALRQKFFGM